MTTKATKDVIDLLIRPIKEIHINGDGGGNTLIDGTPIGTLVPSVGNFTNLFGDYIQVNPDGTLNLTDATLDLTNTDIIGTFNAYYADVAECYEADKQYEAGTIVSIGGDKEITMTTEENTKQVFGVISSDPAMIMNSTQEGIALQVAMIGRVPVKIVGSINKGDYIKPYKDGYGIASKDKLNGSNTVGRSLVTVESNNVEIHTVEATVLIIS